MSGLAVIPQSDMRAITVRQPWASLIAAGAKTIETRPRPTSYRGPVLIHAGKTWNRQDLAGVLPALVTGGPHGPRLRHSLPLGAFVAVANVVDCVKVYDFGRCPERPGLYIEDAMTAEGRSLWLCRLRLDGGIDNLDRIEAQRPYGDYTPGRFALLLEDVTRLPEPVPAKGQRAIPWRVPEDVAAKVREQLEVPRPAKAVTP